MILDQTALGITYPAQVTADRPNRQGPALEAGPWFIQLIEAILLLLT